MHSVTPSDLAGALDSAVAPLLLDVRLADDFAAAHLPGAVNNAVFEVAFHDRLPRLAPEKDRPTVLYGASADSHEARLAAEKLARAGYADLAVLDGGIAAWREAGLPLDEGESLPEPPPPPHGVHQVDLAESRVEWLGRNLLNKHFGTIDLASGQLEFDHGQLVGGEFSFAMNTLRCTDLAGDPLHKVLIGHLLDHDFLDAEEHPEGRLAITSATPRPGATAGTPNLDLAADLTLRGVTQPIEFNAVAGLTPEGKAAAQASFAIDRTRWDILYGSSRFFDRLAGHLVHDLIEFQVRILTT